MKKIVTISLLTVALNVSAGFNNGPWGNSGWNNNPWGGGYNENNGFIAHNPYSMFTPDWFGEEMDDMMDEFDSNNNGPWGNSSSWNNNRWNNNGPWGNNTPWQQNRNWNNNPWGGNTPWRGAPWSGVNTNQAPTIEEDKK